MSLRKSPIAALELGITYYQLVGMLRSRKLQPPQKDSSGDYIWDEQDMDNARKVLKNAGKTSAVNDRRHSRERSERRQ